MRFVASIYFWHGRKRIRPDVTTILVEEGLRAVGAVYWTERLESLLDTISGVFLIISIPRGSVHGILELCRQAPAN
jgi:hypothetical protein